MLIDESITTSSTAQFESSMKCAQRDGPSSSADVSNRGACHMRLGCIAPPELIRKVHLHDSQSITVKFGGAASVNTRPDRRSQALNKRIRETPSRSEALSWCVGGNFLVDSSVGRATSRRSSSVT